MTSSRSESAARLQWFDWAQLDRDTLYALLKLRSEVFVVEQQCVFLDLDGRDADCRHLCAFDAADKLIGTLRLVPAASGPVALGRVVVAACARGRGLATQLMQEGIRACAELFPGRAIKLSAQEHLQNFYGSLGFVTRSERYLDDGIWHVDMIRD